MDKGNGQINKKLLLPQSWSDNHSNYILPQSVASIKNKKESNESNIIDYKNISLAMTGEISSDYIHRNSLMQRQSNVTFVEDMEDDDEQFISNMKMIIDQNCKTQNKENFSVRDLQSKSYVSRKKKCVFSDEDQNLMKRFKKSMDKSKASQKSQQSEHVVSVSNHGYSTPCTSRINSTVKCNDKDMSFRNDTNELLFHAASETPRKDDHWLTENVKTITEIEIEQIVHHEMQFFTPPQKGDL